ncbi:hypothetical protein NFI96_023485, partial [Prochilodus magdalenae]
MARVEPQSPVYTGDTVTLTCELQHSPTGWKFLWYKNPQLNHLTGVDENTNTVSITASIRETERPKAKLKVQPAEHVFIRERVTLTCDIDGGGVWSYEWFKDNKPLSEAGRRKEYELSNVGQSDGGVYSCKGTQSTQPRYSETSNAVTLTVSETPKPKLISGLKGAALSGSSVVLECRLDVSAGWKFYWFKHRRIPQNEIKTDTQSYTIRSVNVSDEESPKPVVSIKPDEVVFKGEAVTLRCDIQSGGATEWKYSWFKNNQPSSTYTTTQEYRISSVTESDSGKYTCRGERNSDFQSSETSDAVTLTVSERPKAKVKVQPAERVFIRERVTLTCDINGGGVWSYEWLKDNKPLSEAERRKEYELSNVGQSDGGVYSCKGTQSTQPRYSETSNAVTLTVSETPKPKLSSSLKGAALSGNSVVLECRLDVSAGWKFYWSKHRQIPQNEIKTDTQSYTIRSVSLSDEESPKPVVSIKPNKVVFKGEAVTLRCDIQSGGATEWKYSWFKNNQPSSTYTTTQEYRISSVTESDSGKYTCRGERNSDSQSSETSDAVTLTVSGESLGLFSLILCNNRVSCNKSRNPVLFRLSHNFINTCCKYFTFSGTSPPASLIISPSRTQHFNKQTLSLSCEGQSDSTGWRLMRYTASGKVSDCSSDWRSVTGSTCNISSLSTSHTGVYWCQSESGGRSSPVNITVHNGDVILESPVHPVTDGDPLTLRCLYRSTKPSDLTAHFYRDGSLLGTQTAGEMTISTVSKSAEGLYHCKHAEKGESAKSWISVTGLPDSEDPLSVFSLLSSLLAVSPYVLSSIILGVKCYRARGADLKKDTGTSDGYLINRPSLCRLVIILDETKNCCIVCKLQDFEGGGPQSWVVALVQVKGVVVVVMNDVFLVVVVNVLIVIIHCGQTQERPKAKVKVQPAERVFIRERVTLTCDIDGGGVWSYEWLKDNKPLSEAERRKEYELSDVGQSDGGVYSCKGTQSTQPRYSETSDAVTLTVSETPKPKLISGLKGAALSGSSVVLECRLDVSAGWKFYWFKHRQIPQNEIKTDTQSYTIRSVNVSDEESPKPVVSIKPDEVVFKGEAVTLRCDIQSGGATEWKYSWFKNNQPSSTYTTTQEYRISSVTESDGGKYTCRGERTSDSQSSKTSDAVTLTVSGAAQAVLSASLQSWLTEGDSVTLSCEVRHSSTGWTFSWYRDNEEILSDSRRGAGGFYTLSPAALNHSGVYECRAKRGEPAFNTHNSNTQPLWITGTSPPASLIISPSRTQQFSKQTLSLSCEGQSDSTGWRVRRYTVSGKVSDCSSDWRSVTGSTCNISSLSTSHTGVYWCQSESGGRSSPVNITVHTLRVAYLNIETLPVTDGDVILESPVHPVTDGDPLTLRCLYRSTKPSDLTAHFYRDGSLLGTQTAGQMSISTVSKSAEGLYHCKHAEDGESVKSWISVRFSGPRSSHGTAGLVLGLSLTLLLILVLSLFWCCKKKK